MEYHYDVIKKSNLRLVKIREGAYYAKSRRCICS